MVLDLKLLFGSEDCSQPFGCELDFSELELWGNRPFKTPVKVTGSVGNRSTIVTLLYTAQFVLSYPCDRCAEAVEKPWLLSFEHTLVTSLNSDDGDDNYIVVENQRLDLDELVRSDILLSLPSKLLCREDCKGLCPVCGKNLNTGDCDCNARFIDPRLEALKKLLDQ